MITMAFSFSIIFGLFAALMLFRLIMDGLSSTEAALLMISLLVAVPSAALYGAGSWEKFIGEQRVEVVEPADKPATKTVVKPCAPLC